MTGRGGERRGEEEGGEVIRGGGREGEARKGETTRIHRSQRGVDGACRKGASLSLAIRGGVHFCERELFRAGRGRRGQQGRWRALLRCSRGQEGGRKVALHVIAPHLSSLLPRHLIHSPHPDPSSSHPPLAPWLSARTRLRLLLEYPVLLMTPCRAAASTSG